MNSHADEPVSTEPPGARSGGLALAVMQPYFLPYVGYFQLIASADVFVLYDDVQFVKQSWVNRNRIRLGGAPHIITIPVARAPLGSPIREVMTSTRPAAWRTKLLRTIATAYAKATSFGTIQPMLESWLPNGETPISEVNHRSIREICDYLGIATRIRVSGGHYENSHFHRADRLVDICRREGATLYINSPGGRDLYDAAMFEPHGIRLRFIRPRLAPYPQGGRGDFVPGLSILDLLMHNTRDEARALLQGAELEE